MNRRKEVNLDAHFRKLNFPVDSIFVAVKLRQYWKSGLFFYQASIKYIVRFLDFMLVLPGKSIKLRRSSQ